MKNRYLAVLVMFCLVISLGIVMAKISKEDINNFNNNPKNRNNVMASLINGVGVTGLENDNINSANLQEDGTFTIEADGRKFTGNINNLPSNLKEIKFRKQDNMLEYGYENGARVLTAQGGIDKNNKLTDVTNGEVNYDSVSLELGKNSVVQVGSDGKIEQWAEKSDKTTKIKIGDKEFIGLPAKAGDESKNYGLVQIVEEDVFRMRGTAQARTTEISYAKNDPASIIVSFKEDYQPSEEDKGKYFQAIIDKTAVEQENGAIKLENKENSIVLGGDLSESIGNDIKFSSGKGTEVYAILDDKDMYVPLTDVFTPGSGELEVCNNPCRIIRAIGVGLRGTANFLRLSGRAVARAGKVVLPPYPRWRANRQARQANRQARRAIGERPILSAMAAVPRVVARSGAAVIRGGAKVGGAVIRGGGRAIVGVGRGVKNVWIRGKERRINRRIRWRSRWR